MALADWGLKPVTPMSDEQFELWQTLVEARTGMTIGQSRRQFLEMSVSHRMREISLTDYDVYYEKVVAGPVSSSEWVVLTDRLTVQETSFFRHPSSYSLAEQHIKQLMVDPHCHSISIWSAGCSTGEEPYSLALQAESLRQASGRHDIVYGVTATDISLPTLLKAKQGIYSERRLQNINPAWREKYFQPTHHAREWQISSAIRQRVAFSQLNLMELEKAPFVDMDLIFCQNVLIYFRRFRKRDVVAQLANRLQIGGILVLGVGEIVDWSHPAMERVDFPDTLAYRRIA